MLTQQDKNRIENAIWVLQQYRGQLTDLYNEGKLHSAICIDDTFWDLNKIKDIIESIE